MGTEWRKVDTVKVDGGRMQTVDDGKLIAKGGWGKLVDGWWTHTMVDHGRQMAETVVWTVVDGWRK